MITVQNYLCGMLADLLDVIGDLPNVDKDKLSLPDREHLDYIQKSVASAHAWTEKLKELMEEEYE